MEYSYMEKQAIVKLLTDMMMADGDRDWQEEQYLEAVKRLLGLPGVFLNSTIDKNWAYAVISRMTDDQKMEVAGMLQQMMIADGVQHNNEKYLWSEIVTRTGIDKAIEHKTAGMNIQYDDAQIYLNASKVALSRRTSEYLNIMTEQAHEFKRYFDDYDASFDEKCDIIIKLTKESVTGSGWDLNDVDGVTWFLGNFIDAMVKSGATNDYDTMFVKCFNKYFS